MSKELILCLHGIGVPHAGVPASEVPFWLAHDTLTTILDKVVATKARSNLPIYIHFDDGNISDALVALPELVKRNLKASFYVCSGRIGLPHYLDRAAIHDLMAVGMPIGSHGKDHVVWRGLDDATLDAELSGARRRLEDVCGTAITEAAIPFGAYDRRVLLRLQRENFARVYTSDRGLARADEWLKPRDTIDATWNEARLDDVLSARDSVKANLRREISKLYKRLR